MNKDLKIFILIIAFLFCGDYSYSANGNIDSLPFNFKKGNLFINVLINNRNYNFLFSSAGYSSVSNEIIEQNNFKINTANQTVENTVFYSVNEIKIGNSYFRNVDAKSFNTNQTFNFKCDKVDGIIGADLLRNKVWKIDYTNKKILFSDFIEDFDFSKEVKIVGFKTFGANYSPMIQLNIGNNIFENVKVNLGFNGSISLPVKEFKSNVNDFKNVKYIGTENFFAASKMTSFTEICVMIPKVKIGKFDLGSTGICFFDKGFSMIGNGLLKDYDVTIDWRNKKIYLDNYTAHQQYKIEDYGFYFYKRYNKIEVVGIYEDSDAYKKGLRNGDVLLKINDIDLTKISEENLCDLYSNFKNYFSDKDIVVTVLRESQELSFNISKQIILN